MKLNSSGHKLQREDVKAFEAEMGCIIPTPYRTFLLNHNGGYPVPSEFQVNINGNLSKVSLDWFLGINVDGGISLKFYLDNYRDRLPANFFSFATTPGGDLICIDMGVKDGAIYLWDHEYESEENDPPTHANVHFIAMNLKAFIDSLTE